MPGPGFAPGVSGFGGFDQADQDPARSRGWSVGPAALGEAGAGQTVDHSYRAASFGLVTETQGPPLEPPP